ncbi:hypothetical protein [Streptomyces acidiscabies]|uniref:hypothetical protein n=1 Tax=Streptomyces acidiscabies TaxID=42234 RepID=UPI0038F72B8B
MSADFTTVLKKPVIALLMPLAIHPEIPPPPPASGTSAGGIALADGTGDGEVPGCGMQSCVAHGEAVLDGVGTGDADAVGAGGGAGLGLGSATAVNTEAHTISTTNPSTTPRRRLRRP